MHCVVPQEYHENTIFIRLLATLDCKAHEMVLKNYCKLPVIVSLT